MKINSYRLTHINETVTDLISAIKMKNSKTDELEDVDYYIANQLSVRIFKTPYTPQHDIDKSNVEKSELNTKLSSNETYIKFLKGIENKINEDMKNGVSIENNASTSRRISIITRLSENELSRDYYSDYVDNSTLSFEEFKAGVQKELKTMVKLVDVEQKLKNIQNSYIVAVYKNNGEKATDFIDRDEYEPVAEDLYPANKNILAMGYIGSGELGQSNAGIQSITNMIMSGTLSKLVHQQISLNHLN